MSGCQHHDEDKQGVRWVCIHPADHEYPHRLVPYRESDAPPHKCPEHGYCDTCDDLGLNTYHGGLW